MSSRRIGTFLRMVAGQVRARLPAVVKQTLRPLLLKMKQRQARQVVATGVVPGTRRRYSAVAKQAVFISMVPRIREAKLAHGLKRRGWNVVLLHGEQPNYDIRPYFDEAHQFGDAADAVSSAARYSPVAYHVFSPSGDLPSTEIIKARVGPTVFDATDLLEVSYMHNPESLERARHAIVLQAHAIKHADGYCARDLQLKLAQRALGYQCGGRVIFFPEYCWGIAREPASPSPGGPETIRCVQAGNFGIEKLGEDDWGYLEVAEKFVADGVGLELFPNWTHYGRGEAEFAKIFSDYLALGRRSRLFRLHRPARADELNEVLRQYDFGIYLVTGELTGRPIRSVNPESLAYCMGARVFDYLDASLPVVLNKSFRLVGAMLARYGAAIAVDERMMEGVRKTLQPFATLQMRHNAVRASRALAVERHSHRLERFYMRVAADAGIATTH